MQMDKDNYGITFRVYQCDAHIVENIISNLFRIVEKLFRFSGKRYSLRKLFTTYKIKKIS